MICPRVLSRRRLLGYKDVEMVVDVELQVRIKLIFYPIISCKFLL